MVLIKLPFFLFLSLSPSMLPAAFSFCFVCMCRLVIYYCCVGKWEIILKDLLYLLVVTQVCTMKNQVHGWGRKQKTAKHSRG